jgi:ubiquinone biosynthesis protein COQ9
MGIGTDTASELHQMSSPGTAQRFLTTLLQSASTVENAVAETGLFASYIAKSIKGIVKSTGAF